jgi:hypothetical protein
MAVTGATKVNKEKEEQLEASEHAMSKQNNIAVKAFASP